MGDSANAYVQIALDGAGKKVKNYKLTGVPQADGTYADVYVQCTSITDLDGRALDFDVQIHLLHRIHHELKWIRKSFGELTDNAQALLGLEETEDEDGADGIGDGS